jgi:hypothetical protein
MSKVEQNAGIAALFFGVVSCIFGVLQLAGGPKGDVLLTSGLTVFFAAVWLWSRWHNGR